MGRRSLANSDEGLRYSLFSFEKKSSKVNADEQSSKLIYRRLQQEALKVCYFLVHSYL